MILKMLESKAIKTIDNTAVTIEVLTLDSVKKCFLLLWSVFSTIFIFFLKVLSNE